MTLYTSVKHTRILTPDLARQLRALEERFGALSNEQTSALRKDIEASKKIAQYEGLKAIAVDTVFSDNLQWTLERAKENHDVFIITFIIDDDAITEFQSQRVSNEYVEQAADERGNKIKETTTYTIPAERFGELARPSRDAEGGQNVVFKEFKKEKESSEPARSEGLLERVERIFHRGWNK